MAGALSRAAKERAEKEAAAAAEATEQKRLEAEAQAKADADTAAKAEADKARAAEEDDKEKDDGKGKPAGKKKTAPPDDEDEDKEHMEQAAAHAEIVELCADAGVPKLAAVLIKEGATLEQAKARIDNAGEIRKHVARARNINPAIDPKAGDDLIAAGASSEHARAMLFDKIVSMQSPDIANRHGAHASSGSGHVATGNHGWDEATAKVVKQFYPNLEARRPSA